jgi:2-dehydropantoate 2-reductase
VKTTVGPETTAKLVGPLAAAGTVVVAMQNGLGVEAPLAEAAPGAAVLGGMCFVCTNKVGPGHIRHLDFGAVTLGEHTAGGRPAGITPAVTAVAADLEGAGVPATQLDDLAGGRWRKLVWNIPFNGLSVVLGAGTDELMAEPAVRDLARALMGEVLEGAGACGHGIPDRFADDMLASTARMIPYATSMKLDHDAGRPLEVGAIYDAPLAAAAAAGVAMPRVAMLAAQLRFLSAGRGTRTATPG